MSEINTLRHELLEIKRNQELILSIISPKEYTVSMVAKITNKSRQAVREWVLNNGEPDVDFYKKGAKLILSEKVALSYINQRR